MTQGKYTSKQQADDAYSAALGMDPAGEEAMIAALYQTLMGLNTASASLTFERLSGKRITDLLKRSVGKRKLVHTERYNLNIYGIPAGSDIVAVLRLAMTATFGPGFEPFNNNAANPGSYENLTLAGVQVNIRAVVTNAAYCATEESRGVELALGQFLQFAEFATSDREDPVVTYTECQHLQHGHDLPPMLWADRKASLLIVDDNLVGSIAVPASIISNVSVSIDVNGHFWTPEFIENLASMDEDRAAQLAGLQKLVR